MKFKFVWGILLLSSVVNAQALPSPPANSDTVIVWNQFAPDPIALSTYTYKYYTDARQAPTTGSPLPAKCEIAITPYKCVAKIPIMNAGPFTIWITASNSAGESARSEFVAGVMQTSPPPVPNQPRLENIPSIPVTKSAVPLPPTGQNIQTAPGSPYEANKAGAAKAPVKKAEKEK
jgi:hypothetical protein